MLKTKEVLELFFKDNENRFSNETIRCYQIALNQFFESCNLELSAVKAKDVRAWIYELIDRGLKPRSIRMKLAAVKSFYQYCIEEGLTQKNPLFSLDTPKIEDSIPYSLDKETLAMLRELTKGDLRDRALIEALYATGTRISELLNIKLEDIKWDIKKIWIRKGKGMKERFVFFTSECAERLKAYLAQRQVESPYLFANDRGTPLSRSWAEQKFKDFTESLNLGKKITPHTMRHTFAVHLAEKGMPLSYIQDLLGHVNANSTMIYTRLNSQAQKLKYDSYQI